MAATIKPAPTRLIAASAGMTAFGDSLELRRAAEGLWAGEADPAYAHPGGRFGGWTAAMLLKTTMLEAGEHGPPLSQTVMFTDAIGDGPIEISTFPLRAGARLQFWRSEISQRGKVCAHAQITFGARRPAAGFTDAKPLFDLPPPDDPGMVSFSPPTKFGELLEATSLPWPADYKPGEGPAMSAFWLRHKQGWEMDHALLAMFADFTPPRPMVKTGRFMMSSTVSINIYFHATDEELAEAGSGHVVNDTVCRRCEGGYFDHEIHLWSRTGALLMTSEQIAAYRD